ncbi:hypothetical protein ACFYUV_40155 [Nonomuraea sp. NPDC003560]|uniref:hypothetical protein n=1 Tax=Nonomuraea sp. NPDC003560 TaxID=3364341 RepID=UPI0036B5D8C7
MTSKLADFIDAMIDLGMTGQVFGAHGIGKTSTFFSHLRARQRFWIDVFTGRP